MSGPGLRSSALPLLLVPIALLAAPGAALPGHAYYFRDFTLTFYPLRHFQALELAAGRFPTWNPLLNEGTFHFPSLYPLDLLHVLYPGPAAVSWLLTLHLPVAALAAYAWARETGIGRLGALGSGAVFALAGFTLSTLNLYVFLQALAWIPALLALMLRAARLGGRSVPAAALLVALCTSTFAVEFVAQAVVLLLALVAVGPTGTAGLRRVLAALALGLGLAAVPIGLVVEALPATQRGAGGIPEAASAFAQHPVSFLQALVPGLFGSVGAPLERWWGGRFFTGGFPYFASLYVGPVFLALASVGWPAQERRVRSVLMVASLLGLWYATGTAGGLAPALAGLPGFRSLRYPSKAVLLPFLAVVWLAGNGLARLANGAGWRLLACVLGLEAALAGGVGLVARLYDGLGELLALSPGVHATLRSRLPLDCAFVAGVALAGVALCHSVRAASAPRAAAVLLALGIADLARAGAGVNPQVAPAFFELLPELRALRLEQGRIFSFGAQNSPAFRAWLAQRAPGAGLWAFFISRQMLAPYNNVLDGIESAEGVDRTAVLAAPPAVAAHEYHPALIGSVVPKLQRAGVTHVLSLDPLSSAALTPLAEVATGVPELTIRVYALAGSRPRFYVACDLARGGRPDPSRDAGGWEAVSIDAPAAADCRQAVATRIAALPDRERYRIESDGKGYLVVAATYARGWTATVDGRPAPVLRADVRYRAVAVPKGASDVEFRYRAPGLRPGLAISLLSALVAAALLARRRAGDGRAGAEVDAHGSGR